ncbi:MAG: hypothetical protein ABIE74_10395 [Pseudomonadota bacterium]
MINKNTVKSDRYISILDEFYRIAGAKGMIRYRPNLKKMSLSTDYERRYQRENSLFTELKSDVEIQIDGCVLEKNKGECKKWNSRLLFFKDNKIDLKEFLTLRGLDRNNKILENYLKHWTKDGESITPFPLLEKFGRKIFDSLINKSGRYGLIIFLEVNSLHSSIKSKKELIKIWNILIKLHRFYFLKGHGRNQKREYRDHVNIKRWNFFKLQSRVIQKFGIRWFIKMAHMHKAWTYDYLTKFPLLLVKRGPEKFINILNKEKEFAIISNVPNQLILRFINKSNAHHFKGGWTEIYSILDNLKNRIHSSSELLLLYKRLSSVKPNKIALLDLFMPFFLWHAKGKSNPELISSASQFTDAILRKLPHTKQRDAFKIILKIFHNRGALGSLNQVKTVSTTLASTLNSFQKGSSLDILKKLVGICFTLNKSKPTSLLLPMVKLTNRISSYTKSDRLQFNISGIIAKLHEIGCIQSLPDLERISNFVAKIIVDFRITIPHFFVDKFWSSIGMYLLPTIRTGPHSLSIVLQTMLKLNRGLGKRSKFFFYKIFPKIFLQFPTPEKLQQFAQQLLKLDRRLRLPFLFFLLKRTKSKIDIFRLMNDFKAKQRILIRISDLLGRKNNIRLHTKVNIIQNSYYLFRYFFNSFYLPSKQELKNLYIVLNYRPLKPARLAFLRFIRDHGNGNLNLFYLIYLKKNYLAIRRKHLQDSWIDKSTDILIFTHDQQIEGHSPFNGRKIRNSLKLYGATNKNFLGNNLTGAKSKQKILSHIRSAQGKLLIYFSGHGARKVLGLTKSREAVESKGRCTDNSCISFKELGDALIARGNLHKVKIVLYSCYSNDFERNLRRYLTSKGIMRQPMIVTAANRDSIAKAIFSAPYKFLKMIPIVGPLMSQAFIAGNISQTLKELYMERKRRGTFRNIRQQKSGLRTLDFLAVFKSSIMKLLHNNGTISVSHFFPGKGWRTVYIR